MDELTSKAVELVAIALGRPDDHDRWAEDLQRALAEVGPDAPGVITQLAAISAALLRFGADESGQDRETMLQNIALELAADDSDND